MTLRLPADPTEAFIRRFLARLRPDVAASFTPDQLAAVQLAFGMRYAAGHTVDLRRTMTLPWGRFYVVLLGGRDRRTQAGRGAGPAYGLAFLAGLAAWLLLLA